MMIEVTACLSNNDSCYFRPLTKIVANISPSIRSHPSLRAAACAGSDAHVCTLGTIQTDSLTSCDPSIRRSRFGRLSLSIKASIAGANVRTKQRNKKMMHKLVCA
jgi:hypothetical protein